MNPRNKGFAGPRLTGLGYASNERYQQSAVSYQLKTVTSEDPSGKDELSAEG